MILPLLALIIVGAVIFHVLDADERTRVLRRAIALAGRVKDAAFERRSELEPFHEALRARTRWPVIAPAIAMLAVAIFARMLAGAGAMGDPATLVAWGGSLGPRTANGEWWRLVTATFVHAGVLALLINLAALAQAGLIVERLVGSLAFAAVFVAAGVFATLVTVSAQPLVASGGAAGAVSGVYGLLLTTAMWSLLHRSPVTMPLAALKRLAPAAVVFVLYHYAAADPTTRAANLAGLITGILGGLLLAHGVSDRKAPARRVAAAMGATLVIAVVSAVPLRGLGDVRPELARLAAAEDRAASAYAAAVEQFKLGRLTADALTQLIERTIAPELASARARLETFDKVPDEQQPLLASAEEYVRLREKSWRLRADALHRRNLNAIREAEKTERAAIDALTRIRAPIGAADRK